MKLPVGIRSEPVREYAQLPDAQRSAAPSTGAAGSDWSSPWGLGMPWSENPPELIPPMRFQTFNRMRNEDAVVKSSLWLYKLLCRNANWIHEPASSDPTDKVILDAILWNFGSYEEPGTLDLSFDQQMAQSLLKFDFGAMFEEMIWGELAMFVDKDGDEHPIVPVSRLMPIFPVTIKMPDGIKTDQRTGRIRSLEQTVPNTLPIPGVKLIAHVLEREGSDWLGNSLIRPMWGSWKQKQHLLNVVGVGWDRWAFGIPQVRYPQGGGDDRKREAENIGRGLRTHERGYITLEGNAQQGWDVEIIDASKTVGDPTPLVHTLNDEMRNAGLQHFMSLGRTGSGSRSVGDVQQEPFYMACQTIADATALDRRRQLYRRFIDQNFGEQFDLPKLRVTKIHSRDIQIIAAAIGTLADAGLHFTDPGTQDELRDMLDLSQLPPKVRRAIEQEGVGVAANQPGSQPIPLPGDGLPLERGTIPAAVQRQPGGGVGVAALSEGDDLGL